MTREEFGELLWNYRLDCEVYGLSAIENDETLAALKSDRVSKELAILAEFERLKAKAGEADHA